MDHVFELGPFRVVDFAGASSPEWIVRDVVDRDVYGLRHTQVEPGDVILDIGANVGVFSVAAATRFPQARVIAVEPVAVNYRHLLMTLAENEITTVLPLHLAVTGDGRDVRVGCYEGNTGGGNVYGGGCGQWLNTCRSTTLNALVAYYHVDQIALLKVDVEGAEYEILRPFLYWDRVRRLGIELHPPPSEVIDDQAAFRAWLETRLPPDRIAASDA